MLTHRGTRRNVFWIGTRNRRLGMIVDGPRPYGRACLWTVTTAGWQGSKSARSENDTVMSFDCSTLWAAQHARTDAVPEMINHVLTVLADLLEETNHACEFSLATGPLTDQDVAESVNALLPSSCRVSGLERVS